MFKKKYLGLAIAATLAAGSAQAFNAESFTVSGYVKNETAALTKDGTFNGQASGPTDTTKYNDSGDLIKSESSVKLFVNGDVGEDSSMHAELLLHNDSKAKDSHFKNSDTYTQSEFLRELYVDTTANDWDIRMGKQQVVWGAADGAKFMDMLNPTDYREMAQNAMDESRIPVWMIKGDKYLENGANVQIVLSQPRENVFAGLNRDIDTSVRRNDVTMNVRQDRTAANGYTSGTGHDKGNAFILKGVDSITGEDNGFLNIVPDLGSVAAGFSYTFARDLGSNAANTLLGFSGITVGGFAGYASSSIVTGSFGAQVGCMGAGDSSHAIDCTPYGGTGTSGGVDQGTGAGYDGAQILGAFAAGYNTNLSNAASRSVFATTKDSAFEYMDLATFATFDAFVNAGSQYVFNMPDDYDMNISTRFSNTTDNGLNYSLMYSNAYEKNPIINLSWRNSSGDKLHVINSSNTLSLNSAADGSGQAYGGYAADVKDGSATDGVTSANAALYYATLRFEQTVERAHNLGAAFNTSLDTESMGPVVLRGEFVYTKDAYQPVIDLGQMSIGNITEALTMHKADKFKYVIGADVTVLTDMMLSAQFIQERNLDFVDTTSNLSGSSRARYTASYANMSLLNGFQKDLENKEFYSIFLSKPFGDSGEGRWNNILMLEEGGGRWNRFDVEYSLTNDLIGTLEYNKYWGDANTQFGQLEAASNVQVGLKYLFE